MPPVVIAAWGKASPKSAAPTRSRAPHAPLAVRRLAAISPEAPLLPCCHTAASGSPRLARSKQPTVDDGHPGAEDGSAATVCGEPQLPREPAERSALSTAPGGPCARATCVSWPHTTVKEESGRAARASPVIWLDVLPASSPPPQAPPGGRCAALTQSATAQLLVS